MPRKFADRMRVHWRAKQKLNQKQGDKRIFMEQCMQELQQSGEADGEDDARDICELLWAEGEDIWED